MQNIYDLFLFLFQGRRMKTIKFAIFLLTTVLAAAVFAKPTLAACCECYVGGVGTTCCGYDCSAPEIGDPNDPPPTSGGGGEGADWIPYLDKYPFQSGLQMAPGSGDVVKPSGYGLMKIIRFAPSIRYKGSGASVCEDSYLKPVVEAVDISVGIHEASTSDLVTRLYENCYDYTAVQTTPTGHVVAGFDTLSKEVKAIGYNHFALGSAQQRNLFCSSVATEAAARSAPYVAEFMIRRGQYCYSSDYYGVEFNFRPSDYGYSSGWYSVALMVDSGTLHSSGVCPWRNKYGNDSCSLLSDIYIGADTNQLFSVAWEAAGCFTNLKARIYQCPQQTMSTRGDPEEVVRSLNVGDSPNLGWFASLPGHYSRFWLDWRFKTNFNGGIMTRVYRGRNYFGWDVARRIINNRNNFTFTKRDFGSSDSWVDQSWSGDMGDNYNYFSFTADKTKEYRFYWRSFGVGGGFFAPVSGFGPASVSEDGYLPFKRAPVSGVVTGNVYQDSGNTCVSTTEATVDSWDVRCKSSSLGDEAYVLAQKTNGSYTCVNSRGGFEFNSEDTPYVTVQIVPADGWLINSCEDAAETIVVPVLAATNEVPPFYIWQGEGGPWVKTFDGDVAAQSSLSVNLPDGEHLAGTILADHAGVVSYGGSSDFGSGNASLENWLAQTGTSPKGRTFSGFKTLLDNPKVEDNYPGLSSLSSGVYHYSQDITVNSNLANGEKIILLVDGNVTVSTDLTVSNGDFLAIIASGNITFAPEVSQAQGLFFADGRIDTGSADNQFLGEGMFLGLSGFSFGRDLQTSFNLQPAEVFTFRPDLLINSPTELWLEYHTWTEVAP